MRSKGCMRAGLAELGRVTPPDLGGTGERQRLDIAADGRARVRALLHEQAEARAARHRLEPERARAGKQIEHAGVREIELWRAVLEHVEQRLAHAVRCRPRGEALRRLDALSSELAGYDSHVSGFMLIAAAPLAAFGSRCSSPVPRRASRPTGP